MSDPVQARTQRMPAELWAALDAEARRTGVSAAELIRQAVELQLAFLAAVRLSNEGGDIAGVLAEILRQTADKDRR